LCQPKRLKYRCLLRIVNWLLLLLFRFTFRVDLRLRILEDGSRYVGLVEKV
jgi:hypothetical protein